MNVEQNKENYSVVEISGETMGKSIEDLKGEEHRLIEEIADLTHKLSEIKETNPTDFTLFKSVNGSLSASEKLLIEVSAAIKIKQDQEKEFNDSIRETKRRMLG